MRGEGGGSSRIREVKNDKRQLRGLVNVTAIKPTRSGHWHLSKLESSSPTGKLSFLMEKLQRHSFWVLGFKEIHLTWKRQRTHLSFIIGFITL